MAETQKPKQWPYVVLKMVGVHPSYLNQVHDVFPWLEAQMRDHDRGRFPSPMRLLKSVFDQEHGTYTVEIRIDSVLDGDSEIPESLSWVIALKVLMEASIFRALQEDHSVVLDRPLFV